MEWIDTFESELSTLDPWLSDAMQTIDAVNRSLQTVPPNAEELANVAKVLSVCCFGACMFIGQNSWRKLKCTLHKFDIVILCICCNHFYAVKQNMKSAVMLIFSAELWRIMSKFRLGRFIFSHSLHKEYIASLLKEYWICLSSKDASSKSVRCNKLSDSNIYHGVCDQNWPHVMAGLHCSSYVYIKCTPGPRFSKNLRKNPKFCVSFS